MILTDEQMQELTLSPSLFNGRLKTKYRWRNATVPYVLSMDHTKEQQNYIESALKTIESVSCVKFVRRTNENDHIEVQVG